MIEARPYSHQEVVELIPCTEGSLSEGRTLEVREGKVLSPIEARIDMAGGADTILREARRFGEGQEIVPYLVTVAGKKEPITLIGVHAFIGRLIGNPRFNGASMVADQLWKNGYLDYVRNVTRITPDDRKEGEFRIAEGHRGILTVKLYDQYPPSTDKPDDHNDPPPPAPRIYPQPEARRRWWGNLGLNPA